MSALAVLGALLLPLAACGGSSGGGDGGGGTPVVAPASMSLGDSIVFTYSDGSGDTLTATITSTAPSRLTYAFASTTDPDDCGFSGWTYAASGSGSTLVTPFTSLAGMGSGTNTWTMTWTSTTAGTATDTGGDSVNFVYTPFAGGMTPANFTGEYSINAIEWSATALTGRTTWGSWIADGISNFTAAWGQNSDGTVTTGNTNPTNTFTVGADGAFTVAFPPVCEPFYTGGLSSDGAVAAFAQTRAGTPPYIGLAVRKAGTHSNADLTGNHHYLSWVKNNTSNNTFLWSIWGVATFDGAGGVTSGSLLAKQGVSAPQVFSVGGTYSVAPDGTFDWLTSTVSASPREGIVLGSGDFTHCTGGTDSSDTLSQVITFPVGAGLSNSTFSGAYWIVGFEHDETTATSRSFSGTVVADGAGNFTLAATRNTNGAISASGPTADTYSVSADGTMSLSGGTLGGAVSPTGRFAFVGGTTGTDPRTVSWWLVRK